MGQKKKLKKALARAHDELRDQISLNRKLSEDLQEQEAITGAYGAENETLRRDLEAARGQLQAGRRMLGESFMARNTGPDRPNRKKLTKREVSDIRAAYRNGATQRELADSFGVNPATISRTVRGIYH